MSGATHTPGPWTVEQISDSLGGTRLQIGAAAARSRRVAVLSRLDESMANARLMAAAPEMLEALIRCVGELEYAAERLPYSNARYALKQVRAAIAKANGVQT